MKKVVYKYEIKIASKFYVELPGEYEIIHIGMQDGKAFMWVVVDKDETDYATCEFFIYGTGHVIDQDYALMHVGTFFQAEFVWHVFESEYYDPKTITP